MIKVLFVCHGNICRSPMAEFVMKNTINKKGIEKDFYIESAATSREEIGNDMYPPVKNLLYREGVPFERRGARQITDADYDYFDYIIGMDTANYRNLERLTGGDPDEKVSLLLDYTNNPGPISDPWYSRDFEKTYSEVTEGVEGLIRYILEEKD